MKKVMQDLNVYEALQQRLDFIFKEFDNIYVSFSGGKDSGLLLNMVIDYKRKYYPERKIGVFHQDFEAQYRQTTEYVERTFEKYIDEIEPYWVCLPMATKTAVSSYEMFWYPWDDEKEELWVRPMPQYDYVINMENNPFFLYKYKMHQEDLAKQFARWYRKIHDNKKTICLLGTRATESLMRYNSVVNKKYRYKDQSWITELFKEVWCASPIYDWGSEDVWIANAKFDYDYNSLYDLYYKAGVNINKMRVASPFNESAKESLNLYRILDPEIWLKLVARVQGANFCAIYGRTKAMGYRNVRLPEGHTWRSYTEFLLSTLPDNVRNNYIQKFNTSIEFWHETGGGLPEVVIRELERKGYRVQRNGVSNYTKDQKERVIFLGEIPDETDDIKFSKDVPSWKRMCYCILKNDHTCKFMGFGLTRERKKHIQYLTEKYKSMEDEENEL